jgi:hypothetical protein
MAARNNELRADAGESKSGGAADTGERAGDQNDGGSHRIVLSADGLLSSSRRGDCGAFVPALQMSGF